jgi:predicted transcriptional regulator
MLQREIGKLFGIHQATVSQILRGDRWVRVHREAARDLRSRANT